MSAASKRPGSSHCMLCTVPNCAESKAAAALLTPGLPVNVNLGYRRFSGIVSPRAAPMAGITHWFVNITTNAGVINGGGSWSEEHSCIPAERVRPACDLAAWRRRVPATVAAMVRS